MRKKSSKLKNIQLNPSKKGSLLIAKKKKKGNGIIMKKYLEKKFGQGTAFDLDYGKLLIIALLIYIAFFK